MRWRRSVATTSPHPLSVAKSPNESTPPTCLDAERGSLCAGVRNSNAGMEAFLCQISTLRKTNKLFSLLNQTALKTSG